MDLTAAIHDASIHLPRNVFKPHLKPYWNDELKKQHRLMTEKRKLWCRDGRPRGADFNSYAEYKAMKRDFRRIHRNQIELFLTSLDADIERKAGDNSKLFWKMVNSRRNKTSAAGPGIRFGETIYRDQKEITEQWSRYFQDLYSPSDNPRYNSQWKATVEAHVNSVLSGGIPDDSVVIHPSMITELIKSCKSGKACGPDSVFYEHLIIAVNILSPILATILT